MTVKAKSLMNDFSCCHFTSCHVSSCASGSSHRGAGAQIREHSSFPGLNPAAVPHPGSMAGVLCSGGREASVGLASSAFILSTVVFRDGPVVVSGWGSKCQKGTSGGDKHL